MAELHFKKAEYPLNIDAVYYNRLNLNGFFRMMKDPSYCYKFYWMEAIVKLISKNYREASYNEIIDEMIVNAWYPVLEYHIHLSGIWGDGGIKDSLERAVRKLHKFSGLPNNASDIEIKNKISEFNKELHSEKMILTQNVPYKALSGFADTNEIDLNSSAGRMMSYYNRLSSSQSPLPYTFGEQKGLERKVFFDGTWISMIQDYAESILGWIQYEKLRWLQSTNPEVPGLVYKMTLEGGKARKLSSVRKLWNGVLEITKIDDVFKEAPIQKNAYDVDHFIPWSFVMNDELWNLMPMESSLNSVKSNKLPLWDKFFSKYAGNQFIMYRLIHERDGIKKLYEECYRDNLHSIWASQELYRKGNTREEFCGILEKNMRPVYDSACRQGYEVWKV